MPNSRGEMTEDELLTVILGSKKVPGLAPTYGWKSFHARTAQAKSGNWITPVQGNGAGFPDLVLVRGSELIFAELKSRIGRLSEAQKIWLDKLEAVATVYVWRPSDLPRIAEILK